MSEQRDPISFEHVQASEEQLALLAELRAAFYGVTAILGRLPVSRFRAIAETQVEGAAMWAEKAVTHGGRQE